VNSRRTAIIALTALAASGCGVSVHFADYRHTVTLADTTVPGTVTDLVVGAGDGHVTISPGGDGVHIHRVLHYQRGTPHPGQQLTNGTLTFTKDCSRCRVDYDLTVPASVRVRVRTDSGRIDIGGVASVDAASDSGSVTVRGIAGTVSARSDSGSITLADVGSALETSTDSGSIRATGLRSSTTSASSDSGSVRLEFSVVPVDVRVHNDSGSVRIAVPHRPYDAPYNVVVKTDSGGSHVDVPNDKHSPAKISVTNDSGSVTVIPV